MTLQEFADLVGQMRQAQRDYFRTRKPETLNAAKSLERKVDQACKDLADCDQGRLFE
jgi:hypothetical protein